MPLINSNKTLKLRKTHKDPDFAYIYSGKFKMLTWKNEEKSSYVSTFFKAEQNSIIIFLPSLDKQPISKIAGVWQFAWFAKQSTLQKLAMFSSADIWWTERVKITRRDQQYTSVNICIHLRTSQTPAVRLTYLFQLSQTI